MAYTVAQKIGKHTYLYEVENRWDPVKKQPRQRRKYLGEKDPKTGDTVTPRKGYTPRTSRDFGHVYLLAKLAEQSLLSKTLRDVFGEQAELLLNLAFYQLAESRPLYLFKDWAESTFHSLQGGFSSQRFSELMESVGRMDRERERFFFHWIERQGDISAVVYDITSLSSCSKLVDLMEWGYNRDGDSLPQVNLGVICA